jgi:hypothetical protein
MTGGNGQSESTQKFNVAGHQTNRRFRDNLQEETISSATAIE